MRRKRLLSGLILLCLAIGLATCAPPDPGDLHITVEVREDLSNTLLFEFHMPLVSDALLALLPEATPVAETLQPGTTPEVAPTPTVQEMQWKETRRGTQRYLAAEMQFEDQYELADWLGKANIVQEVVPYLQLGLEQIPLRLIPTEDIVSALSSMPSPFSRFELTMDDSSSVATMYHLDAAVSAATADALAPYAEVSYHVIMPGSVTESSTPVGEDGVLTWQLQAGQPLEIQAASRVDKVPGGKSAMWVVAGVGILLLAGIVGGVVYWVVSRPRRKPSSGPTDYDEPDYGFGDTYGAVDIDDGAADYDAGHVDTWSEFGDGTSYDGAAGSDWNAP